MINKKGQALVCFVIILPIILILFGYLIEVVIISYNKSKIVSVTKSIIANCIDDCEKNDIIILYKDNNIILEDIDVDRTLGLRIKLKTTVESNLGSIIGKDNYILEVDIKGIKENNKIKYEKGS